MDDWVVVEVAGSEPEAELLCSVLRGAGIERLPRLTNSGAGARDGLGTLGAHDIMSARRTRKTHARSSPGRRPFDPVSGKRASSPPGRRRSAGQYVFADSSGAVLIPGGQIDELLAEGRKVEAADAASRDQIARERVRVNDHSASSPRACSTRGAPFA
jgi:hypothetical protein